MSDQAIPVDSDIYYAENSYQPEDFLSETSSLSSSIYNGVMENGRRYQTLREDKYWSPADDKQFESLEAGHLMNITLDSETPNPLFQSPIESPKHILDIGTGSANWAVDVADLFPDATVRGVDLFPPPVSWMPPNCVLEVDDVTKDWTWRDPFDLIHMRFMIGSFTPDEWTTTYKRCYENLKPDGWIEHLDCSPHISCDDGSVAKDNILNTWGPNTENAADNSGRPLTIIKTMRAEIEKAGFVDIHEKVYKIPVGPWAKDPVLKEAGRLNYHQCVSGMEGWSLWLLTKHGVPQCWTKEEVQVYTGDLRVQLKKPQHHSYVTWRRVWARKPKAGEEAGASKDIKSEQ